jgi:hypothetical protein
MATRRILRIEREARFEAARGVLIGRLGDAERDDGWFRAPGVVGTHRGRDVELRFFGCPDAKLVRAAVRIRKGGRCVARARNRVLRWLGGDFLAIRGTPPPEGVPFALERLLRDFGATEVSAGDGWVAAMLGAWDAVNPEPERLLKVLERLDRVALALEEVRAPLLESGGALLCPFCREVIGEDDPLARCEVCGTPSHPSCFEENGGCVVYGCGSRSVRTSSGTFPALPRERERPDPKSERLEQA